MVHTSSLSRGIDVHVGIWSTPWVLHLKGQYSEPRTPHTFRHAVSLDEHCANFKVTLWNRSNAGETKLGTHSDEDDEDVELLPFLKDHKHNISTSTNSISHEDCKLDNLEKIHSEKIQQLRTTDVEEVWFAVRPFSFLFSA